MLSTVLTIAYLSASGLALLAYVPQIYSVATRKKAREQASLSTWFMWTIACSIDCLYSGIVAHQNLWLLVAFANAIFTFTIFAIVGVEHLKNFRKP